MVFKKELLRLSMRSDLESRYEHWLMICRLWKMSIHAQRRHLINMKMEMEMEMDILFKL